MISSLPSGNDAIPGESLGAGSSIAGAFDTGMTGEKEPSTGELATALGIPGNERRTRRRWMREEDEKLRLLVSYWGDQCGKNGHWDKISGHFEGRTSKDCRKRWFHSLDPKLKRGRWTEREDQVLMEAHEKLGPSWHKIAQLIPGRTDDQCSKRYNDVLDPKISGRLREWSPAEDQRLIDLVNSLGTQWRNISKEMEGRTGLTCRNRWRKLVSPAVKKVKDKSPPPSVKNIVDQPMMEDHIIVGHDNGTSHVDGRTNGSSILDYPPPVPPPPVFSSHSNLTPLKEHGKQPQGDAERITSVYTLEKAEGGQRQLTDQDVEAIISKAQAMGQKVVILQNTYHYHYHYSKQEEDHGINSILEGVHPLKPSSEPSSRQSMPPATPRFLELELMEMAEDEFPDYSSDQLSLTVDDFQIPFNPS